jgi:hypothetical protein
LDIEIGTLDLAGSRRVFDVKNSNVLARTVRAH